MVASSPPPFAVLLKRYRDAANLTQEELAERARLSTRAISDLERGISRTPYRATLRQLADALGLTSEDRAQLYRVRGETNDLSPVASMQGGFLGARPATRLVAREAEWAKVLRALDVVTQGSSRLVVLGGEAGIGKTRLAQEAAMEAARRGILVATGRCYDPQREVAFYPFLEALGTLAERAPGGVRDAIPQRWPALARLLPEYFEAVAPRLGTPEWPEELHRVLRAVGGLLRVVTETMPVALLLDDVHWADTASLDLVQHLVRHGPDQGLLLLATYRPEDINARHPWRRALRDLHREGLVERIPVAGLSREGTARLLAECLGQPASDAFVGLVYGATEGNPFFTTEVLQALIERGDVYCERGHWERKDLSQIEVPESVREAIIERHGRLSAPTRAVLDLASVLGGVFTFDDLVTVGGHGDEEVESALEESDAAGVVRPIGGEDYVFHHGLIQQVLYEALSARRRKRLHRQAAQVLQAGPELGRRAVEISQHFRHGGEPVRAVPFSLLAGEAAESVAAHAEAERHYRTALSLALEVGDQAREWEALEKLGGVQRTVGRYDEALHALERARAGYRGKGDEEGEVRVTAQIAWTHFFRGTTAEGIRQVGPMLARLEEAEPSPAVAMLWTVSAELLWAAGRFEEQLSVADRATVLARTVGDEHTLVRAELWRAYAYLAMDRIDEGVPVLEGVITMAERVGDLTTQARALNTMSVDYEESGQFAEGKRYLDRALTVAERTGDPALLTFMLHRQAQHAFCTGEWEEARRHWEQAVDVASQIGPSQSEPYASIGLGTLGLAQGDEAAPALLEVGLAAAQRNHDLRAVRNAQVVLARQDLLEGAPRRGWERLSGLLAIGDDTRALALLPLAAQLRLALDESADAETLIDRALAQAAATNDQIVMVEALRVRALIDAGAGKHAAAETGYAEACEIARAIGSPHAEAQALFDWGLFAAQRGRQAPARQRLTAAHAIFQRLGARPEAEAATRALAKLETGQPV